MNISSGIVKTAQKVVVYGPEGVGKSTFLSKFPNPLFIDTEGSTKKLNVRRFNQKPSSWAMLFEQVKYVRDNPSECDTLCIDTMDWSEQLATDHILSVYDKKSIEAFGYGKGYVYLYEEVGKLLNLLDEVISRGINVVIAAHAKMRKFEQPDEMGAYDRWEMKLSKNVAPIVKEWADTVLFVNYKTITVKTDDNGGDGKKKFKAQGGKRVMYTSHHPCWDAKNRDGLPEETDFDFSVIAPYIPVMNASTTPSLSSETDAKPNTSEIYSPINTLKKKIEEFIDEEPEIREIPDTDISEYDIGIPQALLELMLANNVTEEDIRKAVSSRGYYPFDTPIKNYDADFINGNIIGAWEQVLNVIKSI